MSQLDIHTSNMDNRSVNLQIVAGPGSFGLVTIVNAPQGGVKYLESNPTNNFLKLNLGPGNIDITMEISGPATIQASGFSAGDKMDLTRENQPTLTIDRDGNHDLR